MIKWKHPFCGKKTSISQRKFNLITAKTNSKRISLKARYEIRGKQRIHWKISPYRIPLTLLNFDVLVKALNYKIRITLAHRNRALMKNSFNFVLNYDRTVNFDVTLICHNLLVYFVSLRYIFEAQLEISWLDQTVLKHQWVSWQLQFHVWILFVFCLRTMWTITWLPGTVFFPYTYT